MLGQLERHTMKLYSDPRTMGFQLDRKEEGARVRECCHALLFNKRTCGRQRSWTSQATLHLATWKQIKSLEWSVLHERCFESQGWRGKEENAAKELSKSRSKYPQC